MSFKGNLSGKNSNFFNKKKGAVSVIDTVLLVVVAVTATIGFSIWFQGYFSSIQQTETEDEGINLNIVAIEYNNLYISNDTGRNVEVVDVLVNGNDCDVTEEIDPGMAEVNIESCLEGMSGEVEVMVMLDQDVIVREFYVS